MRQMLINDPPLPGSYKARRADFCIAQFSSDNLWYRARIEKIESSEKIHVHFIDYGNVSLKSLQLHVVVQNICEVKFLTLRGFSTT